MVTSFLLRHYSRMQERYPSVLWRGDASRREIALTFDDGPHPRDTPRVLDILEKYNLRATFHIVGKSAEQHPNLIRQIHQSGHQPALHCYRHFPFPLENPSVLQTQLERTRNIIADACGISPQTAKDVRPPYGAYTARTSSLLTEWGYRLVMWSCIPPHWMQPAGWSVRQILDSVVPGALIVLHDGHGHGSRVAEILDAIIPIIKSRGFGFVTVEEMQKQREQLAALA